MKSPALPKNLPEGEGDRAAVEGWFGIERPSVQIYAKPPLRQPFRLLAPLQGGF